MTVQDIEAEIRGWVTGELQAQSFGEAFGWAVTLSFSTTPVGLLPVWSVLVTARNPLVGQQPLWRMTGIPEPRPAEAEVRGHVGRMLLELRELSAQAHSGANGKVPGG